MKNMSYPAKCACQRLEDAKQVSRFVERMAADVSAEEAAKHSPWSRGAEGVAVFGTI